MDGLTENLKRANQRIARLEQDARQPRLAMEADGPADKTRERREDAATSVQPMHGDSFSANRVDLDPESSTSFSGDSTGPPTLPCSRDDAANGAAVPMSCLSPLKMRSPTAARGLLPTGKASTRRRLPFISRVFGYAQSRRRIRRGRQLNTPCTTTTAVSAGTSFLPPPSGGLYKQNQGKLWCSIQAVLKVVYVPACFWDRGARCFVRLCARGLEEAAMFIGGRMTRES